MKKKIFKGIKIIDGTSENFDINNLSDDTLHLISTDTDKQDGYFCINNELYGTGKNIIDNHITPLEQRVSDNETKIEEINTLIGQINELILDL